MKTIKVKYFVPDIEHIAPISGGDWIDLRAAEDVEIKSGELRYVSLGIGMILPRGYEAHVAPRSSTFRNFGIIVANSFGMIDNSYCGEEDEWRLPVVALRDTVIHKGDRICQFRIVKNQPRLRIKTVTRLREKSRGGFGSTGTR